LDPESIWWARDLEAIAFLQELNAVAYREFRGDHHRRGVDGLARRDAADLPRRPGFGFKWNMGWMHDTLAYSAGTQCTASTTTTT